MKKPSEETEKPGGTSETMTKEQIDVVIERLKVWLASDEGKESLRKAGEAARKAAKEMEERTKVTDEMLRMRINYKY
jgi:hypothetical protein